MKLTLMAKANYAFQSQKCNNTNIIKKKYTIEFFFFTSVSVTPPAIRKSVKLHFLIWPRKTLVDSFSASFVFSTDK